MSPAFDSGSRPPSGMTPRSGLPRKISPGPLASAGSPWHAGEERARGKGWLSPPTTCSSPRRRRSGCPVDETGKIRSEREDGVNPDGSTAYRVPADAIIRLAGHYGGGARFLFHPVAASSLLQCIDAQSFRPILGDSGGWPRGRILRLMAPPGRSPYHQYRDPSPISGTGAGRVPPFLCDATGQGMGRGEDDPGSEGLQYDCPTAVQKTGF